MCKSNFASVPVYPKKVADLLKRSGNAATFEISASGRAASFECGCFVEIDLEINNGICMGGTFHTNGCGYLAASAKVLFDSLRGTELRQLQGLDDADLLKASEAAVGPLGQRRQCAEVCIAALHKAFEAYRARSIAEYRGDTALICSCFGISEDAIADSIRTNGHSTVEEVSAHLMAGRGCGSCRGLIEEIIDTVRPHPM